MSQEHPTDNVHQAPATDVIQRVAEALEAAESGPAITSITLATDQATGPLLPRRAG
jgi:hypothetical protein